MAVPALVSTYPSLAFLSYPNPSYLSHTVASHSHTQDAKVHNGKSTLSDKDIPSFVRDEV